MRTQIHQYILHVNEDEFPIIQNNELAPLQVRMGLSDFDREVSLVNELGKGMTLLDYGTTHGGYVPLLCHSCGDVAMVSNDKHIQNIIMNKGNAKVFKTVAECKLTESVFLRVNSDIHQELFPLERYQYILCNQFFVLQDYTVLVWHRLNTPPRYLYIKNSRWRDFRHEYYMFIDDNFIPTRFSYDNLINLCIMVKNAGEGFRDVLRHNLPYIDRWTILDTGSTDNTINTIRDVLKDKKGSLYQEPFINFRDSRNRLLDLAGESCSFNVMLDDTYILNGDLRSFLNFARGDDIISSYSLRIISSDMDYGSVRISKPYLKERYKYTIHEILKTRLSGTVPTQFATITDVESKYMSERTLDRKKLDLKLLFKEREENPNDPRSLYYIGETYLCMKDYANAANYYFLRAQEEGYNEEKYDAQYKLAVMNHLHLDTTWEKVHQQYLKAFMMDPHRPEALFMIGYHYIKNKISEELGFMYLKEAFKIGVPGINYGMNVKREQYSKHLPEMLFPLCYKNEKYKLGLQAVERRLCYSPDEKADMWKNIFTVMDRNLKHRTKQPKTKISKKLICFMIDGGWQQWNGRTLYEKGLGGSETCIIKFSETINRRYHDMVAIVFCNCGTATEYNGVQYFPVQDFTKFVCQHYIDVVFVNRYTELIPLSTKNGVRTIAMLHDLVRPGEIINREENMEKILCLTEWHRQRTAFDMPDLADKLDVMSYGLDTALFEKKEKIPYSFIYPSFPTRGLYNLLKIFPRIVEKYPTAHLNIFCDMNHSWCNDTKKEEMAECRRMLEEQKEHITNHGWVNGETLRSYWATSHVWFYPTTFEETCCLTAWEAAASRTLAVSTDVAALQESVGDRGIIIPGNASTEAWQEQALIKLFEILPQTELVKDYLERNYNWICEKKYEIVVNDFVNRFVRTG